MQVVYLGFFETLGEILSGIFNEVLAPILLVVLKSLVPILINAFLNLFAEIIFELEIAILKIIDFLTAIFDIFSGVRYIKVSGQNYFLLNYLINSESLFTQVFWMITILSAGLCLLFTMYSVAKSVSDGALGNEYNSMGKILGTSLKAMLMFLMIPAFMYFAISLSQTLLVYINDMLSNMSESGGQGIGVLIFLSCTLKAGKQTLSNVSFTDELRIGYLNGTKQYYDMDKVLADFDPLKVDLLIMLILELAVILIMLGCIFVFVRRIFEIVVLYITSPLFISAMPLDNGNMFGKWRDMMFAKMVSSFAPVFGMRIFLMFVPHLMGSAITYSSDPMQDSLIKMFLIVGGCYAIYKSQFLLLEIISPEAAMQAKSNAMALVGMAMGGASMVLGVAKAAGGAAGAAMKNKHELSKSQKQAGKSSKDKEVGKGEGGSSQAFRGGSSSGGSAPTGPAKSASEGKGAAAAPKSKAADGDAPKSSDGAPSASAAKPAAPGGSAPAAQTPAPSAPADSGASAPAAPASAAPAPATPAPTAPAPSAGSNPIPASAPVSSGSAPAPAEPADETPAPADEAPDPTPSADGDSEPVTVSDDPD